MRIRLLALAAFASLWIVTAQAPASHVACGDTLTAETVLDEDLTCAGNTGLVLGADDFTVWLNGHTITGPGPDVEGSDGIADDGTVRSGVVIRGGTITGFQDGIDLDASNSEVKGLQVDAAAVGIAVRGDDNFIYRNTTDFAGFTGIEVVGSNTYMWGNHVTGTPEDGLVSDGDNPRLVYNSVDGCVFDGMVVVGYAQGIVARNNVTGCDIGIDASGTGLKVQHNDAPTNCIGMFIDDPAALVRFNTANGNCDTGIVSAQPGATLTGNTANDNDGVGIDAVENTVDGGGNTATGNLAENCLGVLC
jgi:copper-binding protein NosD